LVEIVDILGGVVIIISFYSLKVIIFFDLLLAFFKKIAEQTYLSRFLSCKEKLCSAKKETFYGGGLLFRLINPVSETNFPEERQLKESRAILISNVPPLRSLMEQFIFKNR
jgi:hypothetical protein